MLLVRQQFRQQHSHNITCYEITLVILNETIIIIIITIIVPFMHGIHTHSRDKPCP
jgi:hypothetical protein